MAIVGHLGISVDVRCPADEIRGWLQPRECHIGIDAPSDPGVDQPVVGKASACPLVMTDQPEQYAGRRRNNSSTLFG
jgi:hypothetical protein